MTPEVSILLNVHLLHKVLDCRIVEEDLPRQDVQVLVRLAKPMRMGTLAEDIQILPSAVTASADRLESAGLIMRMRDPCDRRASLLQLTAEGRVKQQQLFDKALGIFRTTTGLSEDDVQSLQRIMQKVHTHIIETGLSESLKS